MGSGHKRIAIFFFYYIKVNYVNTNNGDNMKNESIWNKYHNNNKPVKLNKNINTDILIIGGGITGLNIAYFLKDIKNKITLIESKEIGKGITSKTTAKITYLQQDIYRKLTNMHGKEIARKYYNSQKEAINIILKIIKDNNINCDLEKVNSVLFTNNNINKLNEERTILNSYGVKTKDYSNSHIKNGLIVNDTYTFNPIKYLNKLKEIIENKIVVYEKTMATDIKKEDSFYITKTNNGIIKSKIIILACHYPFFIFPYMFPIKTYIEREYVCSSTIETHKNITLINIDKELYSVRYYQNNLIYGSFDHRLTSNIDYQKNSKKAINNFKKNFNKEPEYFWINQDIISNDLLPIIGKIKDNLYISTAYNTWGMTNSIIGAKIISDLISRKENKYIKLFDPKRINIPLIFNSFIGVFHYLKAYIEGIFKINNPYYIKIKGITYGIYVDKQKQTHKIKLLCPHMKCHLVFNKQEKTWDCPCHGSRFDLDGNIINPPAIKKINNKN